MKLPISMIEKNHLWPFLIVVLILALSLTLTAIPVHALEFEDTAYQLANNTNLGTTWSQLKAQNYNNTWYVVSCGASAGQSGIITGYDQDLDTILYGSSSVAMGSTSSYGRAIDMQVGFSNDSTIAIHHVYSGDAYAEKKWLNLTAISGQQWYGEPCGVNWPIEVFLSTSWNYIHFQPPLDKLKTIVRCSNGPHYWINSSTSHPPSFNSLYIPPSMTLANGTMMYFPVYDTYILFAEDSVTGKTAMVHYNSGMTYLDSQYTTLAGTFLSADYDADGMIYLLFRYNDTEAIMQEFVPTSDRHLQEVNTAEIPIPNANETHILDRVTFGASTYSGSFMQKIIFYNLRNDTTVTGLYYIPETMPCQCTAWVAGNCYGNTSYRQYTRNCYPANCSDNTSYYGYDVNCLFKQRNVTIVETDSTGMQGELVTHLECNPKSIPIPQNATNITSYVFSRVDYGMTIDLCTGNTSLMTCNPIGNCTNESRACNEISQPFYVQAKYYNDYVGGNTATGHAETSKIFCNCIDSWDLSCSLVVNYQIPCIPNETVCADDQNLGTYGGNCELLNYTWCPLGCDLQNNRCKTQEGITTNETGIIEGLPSWVDNFINPFSSGFKWIWGSIIMIAICAFTDYKLKAQGKALAIGIIIFSLVYTLIGIYPWWLGFVFIVGISAYAAKFLFGGG